MLKKIFLNIVKLSKQNSGDMNEHEQAREPVEKEDHVQKQAHIRTGRAVVRASNIVASGGEKITIAGEGGGNCIYTSQH